MSSGLSFGSLSPSRLLVCLDLRAGLGFLCVVRLSESFSFQWHLLARLSDLLEVLVLSSRRWNGFVLWRFSCEDFKVPSLSLACLVFFGFYEVCGGVIALVVFDWSFVCFRRFVAVVLGFLLGSCFRKDKREAMKFGKSLSNQIEQTLPEWQDKFLSYKELKKRLKLIPSKTGDRPAKRLRFDDEFSVGMSKEEINFIQLLEDELEKFNNFFVEKEEEYIIRLKEFRDRIAKAKDSMEKMITIRKEIVDFHGEMVLLENYSALNYTGLVKILKKYDKRTGDLMRLPFIQKVLQQPFYTTDLLYKLVKESEAMLDQFFPANEPESEIIQAELSEHKFMESLHMKSTIAALRVLKEIRSGSSTVSVFSLPPLQLNGLDETWNKIPLLEQEAK
ncbi:SPX domain [Arabidopsis suecica]|uniref:SPX domain n=1 Tax=Arabidopsis suecica TaxID=45249 RepID=A0A8T1ZAK1_ARASU|nr:SPX domain [Arabidopsis suecica]